MYTELECCNCKTKFEKLNREIRKSKTDKHFCSRSCAAQYNNRKFPKRGLEGKCYKCNKSITKQRKYCDECLELHQKEERVPKRTCVDCGQISQGYRCKSCYLLRNANNYRLECVDCGEKCSRSSERCLPCYVKWQNETLNSQSIKELVYNRHHKASAFALIRSRARRVAEKQGWTSCYNCGYDKHVEIAHIKAIADFPEETLICVVNALDNLLPLCPNCHWEFDKGLWKLSTP